MSEIIDTYFTLAQASEGDYKEKGSKFLSFAFPVSAIEDVEKRLGDLQKKYHDARHHCYAYILGPDGKQYRANDDGEPKHSAGDPILGQLKSKQLTDAMIVVVRYFGGTKLGVSGLINAYKTAASLAIDNNHIIEKVINEQLRLRFDYEKTNSVMRWVKYFGLEIEDQGFGADCELIVKVRKSIVIAARKAIDREEGVDVVE